MINWNRELAGAGLQEIAECREGLLIDLKDLLDDYHRTYKPIKYYDIIAGDWLEYFAHLTFVALAESRQSATLSQPVGLIPVTSDLADHAALRLRDTSFHDHLRQAVAELMAGRSPSNWTFSTASTNIVSGGNQGLVRRIFGSVANKRPEVLLVAPYFKCGRGEFLATLFAWRHWAAWDNLQYPIRLSIEVDKAWRMNRALDAPPVTDLRSALKALLPLHLPVALLEGFGAYRDAALALPVRRPKALYSANALHGHLTFKLLAAEWREEGTHLLYHQHGGGYGIDQTLINEEYETRVSDRFYTWGWRSESNQKIQPLSPASMTLSAKPRNRILLSCGDYPKVVIRLAFHPMPGSIQTMHQETCTFLKSVPNSNHLLVRPYPHDFGWGFVAMMRKAAPDANFDDGRVGIFDRYAQSRLVVHNYLGTGYLETMALNVPTLCFYDPDTYSFRAEAKPFMDDLESIGILHRSGSSAARFVAGLGGDPEAWWAKPEVQETRRRFIERYANFTADWKARWANEFRNVIDTDPVPAN